MAGLAPLRQPRGLPRNIPAFFLYGEAPQPADESTVHVETIAARSQQHDWNIAAHRHRDLYQLLVLERGRVEAELDNQACTLPSPLVIVVPPGVVHTFRFQPRTVGLVASFARGLAGDLVSRSAPMRAFLERPAAVALDRFDLASTDVRLLGVMLLREFGRSAPGREAALRGLLAALLANVLRIAERPGARAGGNSHRQLELVARFREAIERRLREHLGIAAYARSLGVTESRLRRACLAAAGQPPIELIQRRMMVEAERQLRYTSMPVAQVAYHLGFEDPAYFTRFFTQRAGMSPRAFRRRDDVP